MAEFFGVPVTWYFDGPAALFGNIPESRAGGRAVGDYTARAQAEEGSTSGTKWYPSYARAGSERARLYAISGGRDHHGAAA
jgi:hypothetical protein